MAPEGAGAILDLRFDGALDPDMGTMFNTLAYELRGPFNELVSRMSLPHKANLDWWVEGPASRHAQASPFFHYYCSLHLVRHLVDARCFTFSRVIVDSRVLSRLLADLLAEAGIAESGVQYAPGAKRRAKDLMKRTVGTPALIARRIAQWLIARMTRHVSATVLPKRPIVLIDTFMTPAYAMSDRWYGSLWDNLTPEMKAETFFVPTLVLTPVRSMYSTYKSLRSSARNFVIQDDYLKLSDILFAFGHKRRIKNVSIEPLMVLGHDLSPLVEEELVTNRDPFTIIESLLSYRFIRRLREDGIEVRLAIDWFEGQVIDKAWNIAVKRFYPAAKRIGYRAFESYPFYLCSYPIEIEREAAAIPDTMALQGRGTIATVREFLPDLDVMVIPSFKSQHVWKYRATKTPSVFTVLAALPVSVHSSVRIINRLIEIAASRSAGEGAMQIIVKPHPTVSEDRLRRKLSVELPDEMVFTDERSFSRLLEQAHILITEASSTCLEALACGVPVIIMQNERGLTNDPVPGTVPADLYRRTRTHAELAAALTYYMSWSNEDARRQELYGERIKELYFEPITREGIDRFMNIDAQRVTPNA